MFGGAGDDQIIGANGRDVIFGGTGENLMIGGGGRDVIYDGSDDDIILSGDGSDEMHVSGGADVIFFDERSTGDVDKVFGFNSEEGDVFYINGFTAAFNDASFDESEFIKTESNADGTNVLFVDQDGAGNDFAFEKVAVFYDAVGEVSVSYYTEEDALSWAL